MADLITDEMLDVYAVTGDHDDIGRKLRERYAGLLDRTAFYQPGKQPTLDDPRLPRLVKEFNAHRDKEPTSREGARVQRVRRSRQAQAAGRARSQDQAHRGASAGAGVRPQSPRPVRARGHPRAQDAAAVLDGLRHRGRDRRGRRAGAAASRSATAWRSIPTSRAAAASSAPRARTASACATASWASTRPGGLAEYVRRPGRQRPAPARVDLVRGGRLLHPHQHDGVAHGGHRRASYAPARTC